MAYCGAVNPTFAHSMELQNAGYFGLENRLNRVEGNLDKIGKGLEKLYGLVEKMANSMDAQNTRVNTHLDTIESALGKLTLETTSSFMLVDTAMGNLRRETGDTFKLVETALTKLTSSVNEGHQQLASKLNDAYIVQGRLDKATSALVRQSGLDPQQFW